jgi:hypothetical protein
MSAVVVAVVTALLAARRAKKGGGGMPPPKMSRADRRKRQERNKYGITSAVNGSITQDERTFLTANLSAVGDSPGAVIMNRYRMVVAFYKRLSLGVRIFFIICLVFAVLIIVPVMLFMTIDVVADPVFGPRFLAMALFAALLGVLLLIGTLVL